jgi:7-cyano-7-deazaguanine synthase
MSSLLLCSGGLDSTTVGYWLAEKRISFQPVFFDYGQHCVEKEWETLQNVLPISELVSPVLRIDISSIYQNSTSRLIAEPNLWTEHVEDEELYIPYRTLLFFSIGACIAQTCQRIGLFRYFP